MEGFAEGRGLYEDGGSTRPDGCTREIAFADSIGGALYGALQYATHSRPAPRHEDFGDDLAVDIFTVYSTEEEPDYRPEASSTDNTLGVVADFDLMGEVRYCNRRVPVTAVCSSPITKHDIAVATSLIYNQYPYEHFDTGVVVEDAESLNRELKILDEIVEGRPEAMARYKLDEPMEREEYYEMPEGINHAAADALMRALEDRCLARRR